MKRFNPVGVARSFLPGAMPAIGRRSYRWELTSALMMPTTIACIEGGVIGVIAKKGYDAPAMVVALLAAAPALANISSFIWTHLVHGRDRVRATVLMQCGVLACVAVIAAAPFNPLGLTLLVVAQLLGRVCMAGIYTTRGELWGSNYPRKDRARATGRLTIVMTIMVGITAAAVGWVMDIPALDGHGFRMVYALSIVVGSAGAWAFSHVRWRGRAAQLASERGHKGHKQTQRAGPQQMIGVLRTDSAYRSYMIAMMTLGIPNLAAMPAFIIALTDEYSEIGYAQSIALTQVLPAVVMPVLSIPLWSKLLDRVHVIRFRVFHSWFFVTANLLMGVGFITQSLEVLYAARIILGCAFGGGMLAWQLGHNDFAPRGMTHIYMGIHVTLTGVRGVFAPFIGTLLYSGVAIAPGIAIPGIGGWVFVLLSFVSMTSALLFLRLDRQTRAITAIEKKELG